MFNFASTGMEMADMAWEMKCREEDMKQRALENERRAIDDARRLVDEKVRQLGSVANTSALLAGFSMMVLVNVNNNAPPDLNAVLISFFGITTATVISCMVFATLNATYILVAVQRYDTVRREIPFLDFWKKRCESDWRLTLRCFSLGVPLFMLNLALMGWVIFWTHGAAKYSGSICISVIALLTILFHILHTNRKWSEWLLMSDVKIQNSSP